MHFQEGTRLDPRRGLATPPFGDGQQAGLQGQELGRQQARLRAAEALQAISVVTQTVVRLAADFRLKAAG